MVSEIILFDEYSTYWICKDGMCLENEGYVGVAKDVQKRWNRHKRSAIKGSKYTIHNAIRKYGDDLKYIILATGTQNECLEFEKFLRPKENIGWNLAKGGSMPPMHIPTKEQSKIASDARIGTKHSEISKKKISENLKGRVQTQDEKDKRAKSLVGKKRTQEQKNKMSESAKNRNSIQNKAVICEETGEIFKSSAEACRHIGVNRLSISKAISRGLKCKKLTWRYI